MVHSMARVFRISWSIELVMLNAVKHPRAVGILRSAQTCPEFIEGMTNPTKSQRAKRRVGYILSQEFAELMALEAAERLAPPPVPEPDPDLGARPEVDIAPDEVNEWLQVFNKPIPSTRTTPPPPSAAAVSKPSRPRSPQEMKADGRISEDDLAEWLGTFGDVPATGQPEPSAPPPASATPPRHHLPSLPSPRLNQNQPQTLAHKNIPMTASRPKMWRRGRRCFSKRRQKIDNSWTKYEC
jgi:hypothetical protein